MLKSLPPELAEHVGSIALGYSMEQFLSNDLPAVQSWSVRAVAHYWDDRDEDGDPRLDQVALIHIVKGDLMDGSLWDQLDAMEADLETVASSILDTKEGDLTAEVEDFLLSGGGSGGAAVMILNSVTVASNWRGYGVGALLAAQAIDALCADCCCVATYPAPMDGSTGKVRDDAIKKLQRVWSGIGFKKFDDRVWLLDPALIDLGDAISRMRGNFGLE